ncbi:hypothetical protein Taro_036717 [Colocasia esculenta]|uniref:PHD-type domain-containing protein n=1 Tax=Colocasia esculenta TaxID=4460 RepID=A0A843W7K7_COLES|nr:hypothetical protein [Colocasia esculenta]
MAKEKENGGGGGRKRARSTIPGALVTYERRKRSSTGSGSVLQGDPSVSSGDQKAREVEHLFCDGVPQLDGCTRMEHHWIAVLEEALLSQDADDGIWSFIKKALAYAHLGITRNLNVHGAQFKYAHEGNGNLRGKSEDSFFNADKEQEVTLQRDISEQADFCVISKKWQKVLVEVLTSEKFSFLCNLLLGNFPGIKPSSIIDFSQIQTQMKNVACGRSVGQFHQDLQQVWERIQKIGQEMVLLATSLSNLSQAACQKQRSNRFGTEENSSGSHTTTQFPYGSEPSTKPEQTEVSCLYKVSICKHCGAAADGECSLICDGCEATYHFSCVKPAVQVIPTQSWYCSTCISGRNLSAEPDTTNTSQDSPHQKCVVCDRLKALGALEQPSHDDGENLTTANNSRESSVSSMDSEEPPQPSTALAPLCKICGTCEDEERKFIECAHGFCLYKYYHIQCLRTSQVASQRQRHGCWYCPSCLCIVCLINKDDGMIVMCDGCDEAYHTYCMKPPRTSVPEGKWYCVPCNILRAKEGMRRYEQWVLQQHGQSDGKRTSGSSKSMDMLLIAADKMETLAATKKNR